MIMWLQFVRKNAFGPVRTILRWIKNDFPKSLKSCDHYFEEKFRLDQKWMDINTCVTWQPPPQLGTGKKFYPNVLWKAIFCHFEVDQTDFRIHSMNHSKWIKLLIPFSPVFESINLVLKKNSIFQMNFVPKWVPKFLLKTFGFEFRKKWTDFRKTRVREYLVNKNYVFIMLTP